MQNEATNTLLSTTVDISVSLLTNRFERRFFLLYNSRYFCQFIDLDPAIRRVGNSTTVDISCVLLIPIIACAEPSTLQ